MNLEEKAARNKKWQYNMIASGNCRNCGKVRNNEKTYCEACLEKKRNYNNLVYALKRK